MTRLLALSLSFISVMVFIAALGSPASAVLIDVTLTQNFDGFPDNPGGPDVTFTFNFPNQTTPLTDGTLEITASGNFLEDNRNLELSADGDSSLLGTYLDNNPANDKFDDMPLDVGVDATTGSNNDTADLLLADLTTLLANDKIVVGIEVSDLVANIAGTEFITLRLIVNDANVLPEPSTACLGMIGVLGLSGLLWRRRRRTA